MARVTNIVATAKLNCELDLFELVQKLPEAIYHPLGFSGLLLRTTFSFKAPYQLYKNGRLAVDGGRSVEDVAELFNGFMRRLIVLGCNCHVNDGLIVSVVSSCNFG